LGTAQVSVGDQVGAHLVERLAGGCLHRRVVAVEQRQDVGVVVQIGRLHGQLRAVDAPVPGVERGAEADLVLQIRHHAAGADQGVAHRGPPIGAAERLGHAPALVDQQHDRGGHRLEVHVDARAVEGVGLRAGVAVHAVAAIVAELAGWTLVAARRAVGGAGAIGAAVEPGIAVGIYLTGLAAGGRGITYTRPVPQARATATRADRHQTEELTPHELASGPPAYRVPRVLRRKIGGCGV
jgi:hypothetical protein